MPTAEGAKWYRFLFAMLSPMMLFLSEVVPDALPSAAASEAVGVLQGLRDADVQWSWKYVRGKFVSASVFDAAAVGDLGVVLRSSFASSRCLHSYDILQPLEAILSHLQAELAPESSANKGTAEKTAATPPDVLKQYPWLSATTGTGPAQSKKSAVKGAPGTLEADAEANASTDEPCGLEAAGARMPPTTLCLRLWKSSAVP